MLTVLLVALIVLVVVPFVLGLVGKSGLVAYPGTYLTLALAFLAKQGETFKGLVVSAFDKAKSLVSGLFKPRA